MCETAEDGAEMEPGPVRVFGPRYKPYPVDEETWNSFAVTPGGAGASGIWTVTPDPDGELPDSIVELIAVATPPYDDADYRVTIRC